MDLLSLKKSRDVRHCAGRAGVILLILAAAAVLIFLAYRHFAPHANYAIVVDGQTGAVVGSREDAQQALDSVLRKQAGDFAPDAHFQQKVDVKRIEPSSGAVVLSPEEAEQQLDPKLTAIISACWLIINDKPLFALSSRKEAESLLLDLVNHYLPRKAELYGQPVFREKVALREEVISLGNARNPLVTKPQALKILLAPAVSPRRYILRRGETASLIAARYRVRMSDLKTANPNLNLDRLRAGDSIVVAGGLPPLTVIAHARESGTRDIPYWVEKIPDPQLSKGETRLIRKGQPGKQELLSLVTFVNGKELNRTSSAGKILSGPVPEQIAVNPAELEKKTKKVRRWRKKPAAAKPTLPIE